MDWMSFHFPLVRRLAEPLPLALVRDGKLQRKAMRQELITTSELESKLREQGIDNLAEVRMAYLEDSREISVLRHEGHKPGELLAHKGNALVTIVVQACGTERYIGGNAFWRNRRSTAREVGSWLTPSPETLQL